MQNRQNSFAGALGGRLQAGLIDIKAIFEVGVESLFQVVILLGGSQLAVGVFILIGRQLGRRNFDLVLR